MLCKTCCVSQTWCNPWLQKPEDIVLFGVENSSLNGEHTVNNHTSQMGITGDRIEIVDLQKSIAHYESNQACILPQKRLQSLRD